ncbi:unnamed protein product [Peronospora destructor]|uniref:Uncharacterized protein n=1 Tax=Peronospora destructor TaxID=86335 RepID=A0AAV0VBJ5_9STRA|nr:unnamed protein product [Peronospora destructor]
MYYISDCGDKAAMLRNKLEDKFYMHGVDLTFADISTTTSEIFKQTKIIQQYGGLYIDNVWLVQERNGSFM